MDKKMLDVPLLFGKEKAREYHVSLRTEDYKEMKAHGDLESYVHEQLFRNIYKDINTTLNESDQVLVPRISEIQTVPDTSDGWDRIKIFIKLEYFAFLIRISEDVLSPVRPTSFSFCGVDDGRILEQPTRLGENVYGKLYPERAKTEFIKDKSTLFPTDNETSYKTNDEKRTKNYTNDEILAKLKRLEQSGVEMWKQLEVCKILDKLELNYMASQVGNLRHEEYCTLIHQLYASKRRKRNATRTDI